MDIKIWGCRGSIPSPGKETLKYGGESTCIELTSETGERTIIDCGSGIRKLGQELLKDKNGSQIRMVLTHAHWDHLSGFPFFIPAYIARFKIYLCGGPQSQSSIMNFFSHQMDPPYFPVDFSAMKADFSSGCRCDVGVCNHFLPGSDNSVSCHSIPLNHPNGGYGFKFIQNGKSFVFLTDNEIRFAHEGGKKREEYVDFCRNVDLLFHDAQYMEEEYPPKQGWGHSTYMDAVNLALDAEVKSLGFFHHDPDRTDGEIDEQLELCQTYINEKGSTLALFACADGMEINL